MLLVLEKTQIIFFSAGLRLVEAEIEAFQLILLVFVWVNNAADIVG